MQFSIICNYKFYYNTFSKNTRIFLFLRIDIEISRIVSLSKRYSHNKESYLRSRKPVCKPFQGSNRRTRRYHHDK